MLALRAKGNIDKFFKELDYALEIADKELLERYEGQCQNRKYNFPSLMEQGIWLGSDDLGPTDEIRDVVKQGTLSIGFVGLAETLICLTGKHHGESEESDELGYKIIKYIRDYCDKRVKETHLNFSCLGTPAETYCKTALEQTRKQFGIVPGVLSGMKPNDIAEAFTEGFMDILVGALICGIARGIPPQTRCTV